MGIMELGAIGELVGGVAVIASLIYVGVQIRQASTLARTQAHSEINASLAAILADIARDAELHRIWHAGFTSPEELTDVERDRFGMILYQMFGVLNTAYGFSALDPSLASYCHLNLDRNLRHSVIREWWSRQREFHTEPFRSYVDARIVYLSESAESV